MLLLLFTLFPGMALAETGLSSDAVIAFHSNPSWILFGLVLIGLEAALPTKGVLGLIGLAMFVFGTFSLADHTNPNLRLSWPGIILLDFLVVGTFLIAAFMTIRGYNQKTTAVTDPVLHQSGIVTEWNDALRRIRVGDTLWLARSDNNSMFNPGDKITVVGQDNLT
ncbi:MAG: serine protease, partial [Alphaproteobacteria bacterium]|nr:serine protease [Alphaproteobacteria bacterium]